MNRAKSSEQTEAWTNVCGATACNAKRKMHAQ